jgi:hypothetical protein
MVERREDAMSYSWGAGRSVGAAGLPALHSAVGVADVRPDGVQPRLGDAGTERQRAAAQLAPMVDVWQRLLDVHVPDRTGRCRTCTKGGTGLPSTPWPCSIHGIAEMARRHHGGGHLV